jgi:hypothetical protein
MVMRGLVFQPFFCMMLINESYLVCLCVMSFPGNVSWQYVSSMKWTLCVGEGAKSVCVWFGAPIMHRMTGRNLASHP